MYLAGLGVLVLGLASFDSDWVLAVGCNILAITLCIMKTFGAKLGFRTRFLQQRLTLTEWTVLVLVTIGINLLVFLPVEVRTH